MTRFTFKLVIKSDYKALIIERLRQDARVSEFCLYKKSKAPFPLAIHIKLKNPSRLIKFEEIKQDWIIKGPYVPKKIIKNCARHYELRENYEHYKLNEEEDERQESDFDSYIKRRLMTQKKTIAELAGEAYANEDTTLCTYIIQNWAHYSHYSAIFENLRKKNYPLCKEIFAAWIQINSRETFV